MILKHSLGEKRDTVYETRDAIKKLDQKIDNKFNDLRQLIVDNILSNAIRDMDFIATKRVQRTTPRSIIPREEDHSNIGGVFNTLRGKMACDVEALIEDTIQPMADDIKTIKENQGRCLSQSRYQNQGHCQKPKSCLELLRNGHITSGVYQIYITCEKAIKVFCDQKTDGGGWIVFQRRQDGSVDFYRNWLDYKTGFGVLEGEFWLGNDNLHRLTSECCHELRIDLVDFDNKKGYAKYTKFSISAESTNYVLLAQGYSGDIGDSLAIHSGQQFSTKDKDNDNNGGPCASSWMSGWWYHLICAKAHLNGRYNLNKHSQDSRNNFWYGWKNNYNPIRFSEMKLRETVKN